MVLKNTFPSKETDGSTERSSLRADIVDRNGAILATCIKTASCYADPSVVIDIDETALKLSKIHGMPQIEKIKFKLSDKDKHFVWLARHIPPRLQQQIMDMGLPGIFFKKDYKRIYPFGHIFSHIIGCSDIDCNGLSGIEKKFDKSLSLSKRLLLTVDLRIQAAVHEELKAAIEKFHAIGGNAIVLNMAGEVLAMVSLPDFDSNNLRNEDLQTMFNRNTMGAYEPGSTFKVLNTAIAIDGGSATLDSMFDASNQVRLGRFLITDFRGKNRVLSLAEAFVFSSNIAAVKICQQFGGKAQRDFMRKVGVLDKCEIELPEVGSPIYPSIWRDASSMTISYGYGIAVSPIQLVSAIASIINLGRRVYPTLICNNAKRPIEQIVSEKTSELMRELMRAVVLLGTAKKAAVNGLEVLGKTGTAYKNSGNGYGHNGNRSRITTFVGGFPARKPKYMLVVMLDDPKPIEGTYGYATAGWNAAPTAGKILERIASILGERFDQDETTNLRVTKYIKLN
jgi:cell division protein FtsI (penicillin-binding protein 3)